MSLPESPQAMMERRLLAICSNLYGVFGDDANHPQGLRARASIWNITHPYGSREPTCQGVEEVLQLIHEQQDLDQNTRTLAVGDLDVHPRDHDYAEAKDQHRQTLDGMILTAIRQNLINNQ